jgi:hypothetical protein
MFGGVPAGRRITGARVDWQSALECAQEWE